jgi:hypothetical protein
VEKARGCGEPTLFFFFSFEKQGEISNLIAALTYFKLLVWNIQAN